MSYDRQPTRTRTSIAAISLACLIAFAGRAHAQSAEAESLFSEGDSLMKQGKIAEACDAFAASNKIEARAGTLIRLGECREKNHQLASAWSAFKDALTRVKDPKKKKIATEKVAELEKKLSFLTISVPDGSRLDGLEVARNGQAVDAVLWNRAVAVDGGEYTIAVRAPKHADWQKTIAVPEAGGKISVDIPKLDEPKKGAPPPTPPVVSQKQPESPPHAEPPPPDEHDTGTPAPSMWTGKRKAAVGVGAVAVVGVVAGAILGSSAKGKQNNAYSLCPDPQTPCADAAQANQLISDGKSLALDANIAFGVAGAAAIAAGVLWFTGAPEHAHGVAIVPHASSDRAGLAIVGRF